MKYLVQGNYRQFQVTLTQRQGELITPYVPTDADEVSIILRGARTYEYPDYEQSSNVLTFVDNGCLKVGLYALEVKIVESTTHRLRCMYREQIRVVASNDDIPTNADFEQDDIELQAEFEVAASVIVVDDELSLTSTNPVQNRVVTAALNDKGDNLESVINLMAGVELKLKRGDVVLSNAVVPFATLTQGKGGLMTAYDYAKLAGIEAGANKTIVDDALSTTSENPVQNKVVMSALNTKYDNISVSLDSSGWDIVFKANGVNAYELYIGGATSTAAGLFLPSEKTKLAGIEAGANKTVVDSSLSSSSENPVQNKAVEAALNTKYDNISVSLDGSGWDIVFKANGVNAYELFIGGATSTAAGLFLPSEKAKLDALPNNSDLQNALNAKGGTLAGDMTAAGYEIDLKSGNTSLSQVYIPFATSQDDGLMSATDYAKLAGIATGATRVIVDSTFDTTSNNAISNSAVATALGDIESILDNINGD